MVCAARSGDVDVRRPMYWLALAMAASAAGLLIGVGYVALRGHIPVPSLADAVRRAVSHTRQPDPPRSPAINHSKLN
jgi:hypothetical protein